MLCAGLVGAESPRAVCWVVLSFVPRPSPALTEIFGEKYFCACGGGLGTRLGCSLKVVNYYNSIWCENWGRYGLLRVLCN